MNSTLRNEAHRPFYSAHASVSLRALARLAVRLLGPGPLRLRMLRYLHELHLAQPEEGARAA